MRSTTRSRVAGAAVAGLALAALAGPSATAQTTTTTFTLEGGTLSISVPPAKALDEVLLGADEVSAQLGAVTVTDSRGGLNGAWTATVSSSDFVTDEAASSNTIAKANVEYMSGPVVPTGGAATVAGTGLGGLVPVALDVARTAAEASSIIGAVSASWDPTVTVTVPNNVVAGDYTGTVTHSVA